MNENYDELKQKYEATEKELESNKAKIIELYEKTDRMKELEEIHNAKHQQDKEKQEAEIEKLNKILHPFIINIDEITEFLKERAWEKEQKARAERDKQEQEEKDRAKKELGIQQID
jgi:hypothetical protein